MLSHGRNLKGLKLVLCLSEACTDEDDALIHPFCDFDQSLIILTNMATDFIKGLGACLMVIIYLLV